MSVSDQPRRPSGQPKHTLRKPTRIGLLGGLAAVALALSLSAWSSASAAGPRATTLRFVQVQTSEHFVSIAPAGTTAGDMDVVTVNLLSSGKVVGHGRIVGVAVDFPNVEIMRTDVLSGGHISTLDTYNDTVKKQALAIVGGTGAYRGARGTLTLTRTGSKISVVFTILK